MNVSWNHKIESFRNSNQNIPGDFFSIESSFSHSPSELLLDTVDTVRFVGSGVESKFKILPIWFDLVQTGLKIRILNCICTL